MSRTIITIVGKDTVRITVKVCMYLADNRTNISDVSQTIIQGSLSMMVIVDNDGAVKSFEAVSEELKQLGDETGTKVKCQRERILTKMHRIQD